MINLRWNHWLAHLRKILKSEINKLTLELETISLLKHKLIVA